jgi:hypothetical protein
MYCTLHRDGLTDLPSLFLYLLCPRSPVASVVQRSISVLCELLTVSMPRSRTLASALCFSSPRHDYRWASPVAALPCFFTHCQSPNFSRRRHLEIVYRLSHLQRVNFSKSLDRQILRPHGISIYATTSKNPENPYADHIMLYNHPRTGDEFGSAVSVQSGEVLLFSAQLSRKLKLK